MRPTLLLFTLLFLFYFSAQSTVYGKGSKKKNLNPFERKMKNRREEIRKTKCNFLIEDLQPNCQNYYISPTCFRQVYGDQGLEFGEVPGFQKENEFNDCFKKSPEYLLIN